MASFEQAVKFGVDMIELDVHGSKDGSLIVIHDDTTARTARGNPQGAVGDLTLAQLKKLDVGVWKGPGFAGERVATLDEVLAAFKGRAMFLIELKARGIEERVAQVIHEAGMEDRVEGLDQAVLHLPQLVQGYGTFIKLTILRGEIGVGRTPDSGRL